MASVVKNAAMGQGKAMTALYQANKNTLYSVAHGLLLEEGQASAAVYTALRETWSNLGAARLSTPEQFTALVVSRTVEQCKKLTLQKNPKALRVPHGRNVSLPDNLLIKDTFASEADYILANLPVLHRYVLVLSTLAAMSAVQIARLLQMDLGLVEAMIAAQEENIAKLQSLSAKGYDSTLPQIVALLALPQAPEAMNAACRETIDTIATAQAPALKKRQVTHAVILSVAIVCVVLITMLGIIAANPGSTDGTYTSTTSGTGEAGETSDIPQNSAPALDENTVYYADIDIADYGKITVKLDQASAPATCANFVNLVNQGFYDGLTFHRIMEDFMMQGGCPNGDGTGGAEENVVGEFTDNGYDNPLSHTRGAIAMARATDPNSASSQFFICHRDVTSLDGQYAVFGYVTEGIEVVDQVCVYAQPTDDNGTIPAEEQPVITSITIRTEPAA